MTQILRISSLIVLLVLAWQLGRTFLPEQERAARSQVKATAEAVFPQQAKEAKARFGLKRLHEPTPGMVDVVLIHGLDDPGKVWMNLAPALHAEGFGVSVMEYPNDQPIHESATEFSQSLRSMSPGGVDELAIVAHSMGGLVSREVLTNPSFRESDSGHAMPVVTQLIMVGTPNHGSHLARFRGLGELREQTSRIIEGKAGWLDSVFDGAGEAGLDLLPGSPFLAALNSRGYPEATTMRVIAGVIAKDEVESFAEIIEQAGGADVTATVIPLAEMIGDGLVSLESASLPGVPIWRVSGNHLSMIRNLSESSERVPPAIPIILQLLRD